jgi:hypothetical protein
MIEEYAHVDFIVPHDKIIFFKIIGGEQVV